MFPREITSHITSFASPQINGVGITVVDEPGAGGAHHAYDLHLLCEPGLSPGITAEPGASIQKIRFQNGPIAEAGINGVTNEALLAIVEDRLACFQKGPYACRENAIALTKLQEAMMWLQKRTLERARRGVEGTSQV